MFKSILERSIARHLLPSVLTATLTLSVHGAGPDGAKIEQLTGLKGSLNPEEGVFKVTAPRGDLPIRVDGWRMPPFMGLTTWAAFIEGRVTALHNHFFFDEPKVYFMHIGGEGTVEKLANGVKLALAKQKEVRAAQPAPVRLFGSAFAPSANSITSGAIEGILGTKGQANNGMFKIVIGREAKMPCGCAMTKEMGVNTWAAFAGTDDDAVVDGDFCVLEDELQPVLKSLRQEAINIVAIHHHMTHENPRFLFLHYWGRGKAESLARSLKHTLDAQKAVK